MSILDNTRMINLSANKKLIIRADFTHEKEMKDSTISDIRGAAIDVLINHFDTIGTLPTKGMQVLILGCYYEIKEHLFIPDKEHLYPVYRYILSPRIWQTN